MADSDPGDEFRRLFEAKRAEPARAGLPSHRRPPGVTRSRPGGLPASLAQLGPGSRPSTISRPGSVERLQPRREPLAEGQSATLPRQPAVSRRWFLSGPWCGPSRCHEPVRSLPDNQRKSLVLVTIIGLRPAEAARDMGANEDTVRVRASGRERG